MLREEGAEVSPAMKHMAKFSSPVEPDRRVDLGLSTR